MAKGKHGSGSVIPHGKRWRFQWWEAGSRRYLSFDTEQEALDYQHERRKLQTTGGWSVSMGEPATFASGFSYWLAARNCGEHQRHDLRRIYDLHLEPYFGANTAMNTIEPVKLVHYRDTKQGKFGDREYSATTVRRHLTILRGMWKLAISLPSVPVFHNPAINVERPSTSAGKYYKRAFTDSQFSSLLSYAAGTPWHDVLYILGTQALRLGELKGLQVDRYDPDTRILSVLFSWNAFEGKLTKPKTVKGVRDFRVDDPVVHDIFVRRQRGKRGTDFMFPELFDTADPLHKDVWPKALVSAGINGSRRVHDLRHTAITRWIREGMPINVASQMAGHSSAGFTLDHYSVDPEQHSVPAFVASA